MPVTLLRAAPATVPRSKARSVPSRVGDLGVVACTVLRVLHALRKALQPGPRPARDVEELLGALADPPRSDGAAGEAAGRQAGASAPACAGDIEPPQGVAADAPCRDVA